MTEEDAIAAANEIVEIVFRYNKDCVSWMRASQVLHGARLLALQLGFNDASILLWGASCEASDLANVAAIESLNRPPESADTQENA